MIEIRTAALTDWAELAAVEAECFPPAEAASPAALRDRLAHFPRHFWLLTIDGRVASFVNGMTTDTPDLTDEMYADAALHDESGAWQMIFGVNTRPEFRRRGYAGMLLRRAIADARADRRRGLVLTCKDALIPYYTAFGFRCEGRSDSVHGGAAWNQMRLRF